MKHFNPKAIIKKSSVALLSMTMLSASMLPLLSNKVYSANAEEEVSLTEYVLSNLDSQISIPNAQKEISLNVVEFIPRFSSLLLSRFDHHEYALSRFG